MLRLECRKVRGRQEGVQGIDYDRAYFGIEGAVDAERKIDRVVVVVNLIKNSMKMQPGTAAIYSI
jgi:hypothetical protein